jgi:hypothetical protein
LFERVLASEGKGARQQVDEADANRFGGLRQRDGAQRQRCHYFLDESETLPHGHLLGALLLNLCECSFQNLESLSPERLP